VLEIEIDGRIERSSTAQVRVVFEGEPVADSLIEWTAEPPNLLQFLSEGRVTFLSAGTVTLQAEAQIEARSIVMGTRVLEIALPPRVVFDLLLNGNRDIYSMFLDGDGLESLTDAAADDEDPTAAGGTIVFTSFRDGNAELYSVPLDGSGPAVRLTDTADSEIQPALTPGGGQIAYTANPTGVFKLWTVQADGSNAQAVTVGFGTGGSVEASPSWGPSGDRLVFVSTTNGTADVFTLQIPGGTPTVLVLSNTAAVEPAWSMDGESVVFASDSTGDTELFLLDLNTMALTQLTDRPGADGEPAWLPDGRIVYTAWIGNTPTLRWLDPADPSATVEIPTGTGAPRRAAGVLE
jgi:Tol biopolymer transport system component